VKVTTGATLVMERVMEFFAEHPREILETVITKKTGREGREYWTLMHPDTYEADRVQSRVVRYPTRQERLAR